MDRARRQTEQAWEKRVVHPEAAPPPVQTFANRVDHQRHKGPCTVSQQQLQDRRIGPGKTRSPCEMSEAPRGPIRAYASCRGQGAIRSLSHALPHPRREIVVSQPSLQGVLGLIVLPQQVRKTQLVLILSKPQHQVLGLLVAATEVRNNV